MENYEESIAQLSRQCRALLEMGHPDRWAGRAGGQFGGEGPKGLALSYSSRARVDGGTHVFPVLRRLKQEDCCKFETSLVNRVPDQKGSHRSYLERKRQREINRWLIARTVILQTAFRRTGKPRELKSEWGWA